jgi:ubiquinol-cytochrome c reductase iron-sulfur subunit
MEFTQIDVEASFIDREGIYTLFEGMLKKVWQEVLQHDLPTPFPRLAYHDAMNRYGVDKPDTRFALELVDLSDTFKTSGFKVFASTIAAGAAIDVDLSAIAEGAIVTVKWRGKPIFVRHRTPKEIKEAVDVPLAQLPDPQADAQRVKKPEWLVVIGVCTHLGCIPLGHSGDYWDERVQNWNDLAYFIAQHDSLLLNPGDSLKYNRDSIDNWIKNKQKHRIALKNKIPIYIRYFSCEASNSRINFYDDIYDDDKRLIDIYFADK